MEPSDDNYIIIRRDLRILNPRPEESILVSLHEWDSLTQRVDACKIPVRPRVVLQGVTLALGLLGIVLAAVTYFTQLPDWVFGVGIGFCAGSLGGGFGVGIGDLATAKEQYAAIGRFAAELTNLRRKALRYPPPEPPEPGSTLS